MVQMRALEEVPFGNTSIFNGSCACLWPAIVDMSIFSGAIFDLVFISEQNPEVELKLRNGMFC